MSIRGVISHQYYLKFKIKLEVPFFHIPDQSAAKRKPSSLWKRIESSLVVLSEEETKVSERMKIRRKNESRPFLALNAKSVVLGCIALVIIFYVAFFAKVIEMSKVRENFPDSAYLRKNLDIPADHGDHDQLAIDRLGQNEQAHEVAPVAVTGAGDEPKKNAETTETETIGFAVTITGCGKDPITEGAAVLKHSIHLASMHGNLGGKYDYKMYAIYHPSGLECAKTLESLGYTLVERETPVAVKDIEGEYLRSKIEKNGCCGEKELVKLEAYTLTQHPVVVHLDLDTLILQPLDGLFDWMLAGDQAKSFDSSDVTLQWPEDEVPQKINAFFTRDCEYSKRLRKRKSSLTEWIPWRVLINVSNLE